MARPKRTLAPDTDANSQPSQKVSKGNVPSKDSLAENGATAVGTRKRKIQKVNPMPRENIPDKRNAFKEKNDNEQEKSPVIAKRRKEALEKRTSKKKKVTKKDKKAKPEKKEPKKTEHFLSVPKIPALPNGEALTVGCGDVGQLGLGSDVLEKTRPACVPGIPDPVVSIVAGGMHTVCLTSSGKVYSFGCNDDGTLGRVTKEEEESFVPGIVDLPEKVVTLSAGDTHSAALTESGKVYIWGNFRDSEGLMGLTPSGQKEVVPIQILPDVSCVSIASGTEHLACLGVDGMIYTIGCAEQGQLGRISHYANSRGGRRGLEHILKAHAVHFRRSKSFENYPPLFDQIWTGAYCTFVRERHSNGIFGFGLNDFKQLGKEEGLIFMPTRLRILDGKEWKMISGGNHHVIALDSTGQVYTWGRKDDGRLGLGDVAEHQEKPVLVPTLRNVRCTHVAAGSTTSYAISEEGKLYSWGFGETNQLGHGGEEDSLVPKVVESKNMSSRVAVKVDGGGQHTVILATPKEANVS